MYHAIARLVAILIIGFFVGCEIGLFNYLFETMGIF